MAVICSGIIAVLLLGFEVPALLGVLSFPAMVAVR